MAILVRGAAGSVTLNTAAGSVDAGGTVTLTGSVRDTASKPLAGAAVDLSVTAGSGAIAPQVTTASNGAFQDLAWSLAAAHQAERIHAYETAARLMEQAMANLAHLPATPERRRLAAETGARLAELSVLTLP